MDLNLGYTQILIIKARAAGVLRNQLAYILATAYWETAHTMKPVAEAFWVKNAEEWRKKNLRYYPWYGRGYVQLTWEKNYIRAGKELGIDLTTDPRVALDPAIAAEICIKGMQEGWFTGKKLSDFITLSKSDFVNARKIINGKDKAHEIAEIAEKYDTDLKKIGYGDNIPVILSSGAPQRLPDDPGVLVPEITKPSVVPSNGLINAIVYILSKLFPSKG